MTEIYRYLKNMYRKLSISIHVKRIDIEKKNFLPLLKVSEMDKTQSAIIYCDIVLVENH
ncbi:hypothetical protein SAMN05421863_100317 [Nitrosomonas communis]|uniref:Uncharacterized protein n=1 Tax=Nitrosomonas communis TaxID=44574 RepID=A0A1I4JXC7_9PROT|nr:hypothetical protein SAMN05421863_100317 [Nitrosomonas communis]